MHPKSYPRLYALGPMPLKKSPWPPEAKVDGGFWAAAAIEKRSDFI